MNNASGKTEKILVIKLGALGDFIQALGPMAAIRKHHPDANITLLTTKSFKDFAVKSGYFNQIRIDEKPKLLDVKSWLSLRKYLNSAGLSRVYDLQNNDRTSFYFRLFSKNNRPEWVGVAKGASHRNSSPERTAGHAFDGHVQTLKLAGIDNVEIDTLDWIEADISSFKLKNPYVLFVPGSAPEHPGKRWPAAQYGQLAEMINNAGYQPVLLGTEAEKNAIEEIINHCPRSLDLNGQTSLEQIITLAKNAAAAIGNDTGPMHLIAATNCPSVALFSTKYSNPARHSPKGKNVTIVQKQDLHDLEVEEVAGFLNLEEIAA